YGIHDLSRTELDPKTKLPRFNMPLELGVFLGATYLGDKRHQQKKCLILDKEKYRYQKFISDIAGNDPESHDNKPEKIIAKVRNWLAHASKRTDIPGPSQIIRSFNLFNEELPIMCKEAPIKVNELEFYDYALMIAKFIKRFTSKGA
ncbi:MAG TPA: hypothetical protein VFU82_07640, partial [Gammaproteobacteria bacterium]|nr:hypothetical protein [Gammaproteobacteria bacterium]